MIDAFEREAIERERKRSSSTPCADCGKEQPLPKLSLCINSHNEGPDLLYTILSVRKHYAGPFEAIVVDDAGMDGSTEQLPDYVRIIRNETRVGCGRAKAQAVAAATGDVILHMDGHCRVLRGRLEPMVRVAAAHECIVVPGVAPLHCRKDELADNEFPYKEGSTCYGGKIESDAKGVSVGPAWKPRRARIAQRECTWYAIFMFSRKTLDRLGGWNEYPGTWGSQEIGLALRAWFADVPVYAFRDIVCGHRYQDDGEYKRYEKELKARGIRHYKVTRRETAANAMYAVRVVFDPQTIKEHWEPFWKQRFGEKRYAEACALLAESTVEAQAEHFRMHCKRRTDEDFFRAHEAPWTIAEREAAPEPAEPKPGAINADDVTAIILHYKRPINCQKAVDALRANGIRNVWVYCQEGIAPPRGATRVFTDTENAMTWARYAVAPLASTRWILFCDDDVELLPAGIEALLRGAAQHPDRNLGLIGCRFTEPFDSYRKRIFYHAEKISEPIEVDMLWPKGQIMPRDMSQRIFGRADLWQAMRERVGGTSGDDFVGIVAQRLEGLPPPMVVPSKGTPYREHHAEGKEFALSKQGPRYTAKRRTFALWRELGWRPILMDMQPKPVEPPPAQPKADDYESLIRALPPLGAQITQHPRELAQAWALAKGRRYGTFVEVGAAWGGTLYLYAHACTPGATVLAVDDGSRQHCRNALKRVIAKLREEGYDAQWFRGDSRDPAIIARVRDAVGARDIGLLHIDGGHSLACVQADTENYLPLVAPDGLALYHDIATISRSEVRFHWREVADALSTDTYYCGQYTSREECEALGKPWRVTKQHGGYGIGIISMAEQYVPLTVFTPFGPQRPWAIDLWARNIEAMRLEAGTRLLLLDNMDNETESAALEMCARAVARAGNYRLSLIRRDWCKRSAGVNHLRKRMLDIWRTARPFMRGAYVLSLESDVEPENPAEMLAQLRAAIATAPIAAACLLRRKDKTPMVVEPSGRENIVEAKGVHLGCTLINAEMLRRIELREAASWGGGVDMAICEALGGRPRFLWNCKCRHYVNAGEFVI